jgi:Ca2+-transporting ATPase
MPRRETLPFDSERKRMTVIRHRGGCAWAFVKGAPEVIIERCVALRTATEVRALHDSDRARMLQASARMAHDALRVLALAERSLDTLTAPERIEQELTLLRLVGLQDPLRAEAFDAVQRCKRAGIRPVMITGDHPNTAGAIARALGILEPGDAVVVGRELDRMDEQELTQCVPGIAVYARITAEHKLRIVRAWKAQGMVVAMTGDGVNDAPALKEASIGVAMGVTDTEVTKEAAAIILTDDNFASIVAAVEEGRGIYDNITKTLAYVLSGNVGELTIMFIAALVGWLLLGSLSLLALELRKVWQRSSARRLRL